MSLVPDKSVIVIGGGVCGLVAAHALARAGAQVTLVEASGRPGGQVRSEVLRRSGEPGEFAVGEPRSGQADRDSAAPTPPDGVNATGPMAWRPVPPAPMRPMTPQPPTRRRWSSSAPAGGSPSPCGHRLRGSRHMLPGWSRWAPRPSRCAPPASPPWSRSWG
ncbi:hypothetical protein BWX38_08305 [Acidipropionibacterium acidipropionici]|nr:hypothetical protein BWX38_08305 [Acidipropionibacterium acidipropionici]